ncbi:MAG: tRNA threonylcarbamoyladenosine dehydratase [Lachnospiraceae bacterium]|nr:tRNA threonylcarbamoyladenosine dehydratase [Lachnospiraceae bacterium]
MLNQFSRTELLLGSEAMKALAGARVAVFGIGGVGGFTVEALIRSGVGAVDLIDNDKVCLTNLNRQLIATRKTVGRSKTEVMKERILEINPDAVVTEHRLFYLPETAGQFDFTKYSYVVDAVDTVTAKIALVMEAQKAGVPIISSMGAGNKLDPTGFEVADIYKTSVCPLAKVMRRELKKRNVTHLKVVYSKELPLSPLEDLADACREENRTGEEEAEQGSRRRALPGSVAFVPSVVGLIIAGEVIRDLAKGADVPKRGEEKAK